MKFGKNLGSIVVPEWEQCYLNYEHLKIFVKLIKRIVILITILIEELSQLDDNSEQDQSNALIMIDQKRDDINQLKDQLIQCAHQVNSLFYNAHRNGIRINNRFFQMKMIQFHAGYEKWRQINTLISDTAQKDKIKTLIEFLYIEASYLRDMKENNVEGERKILKKHKKYADNYVSTPPQRDRETKRLVKQLKYSIDDLQNFYVQISDGPSKKSRSYLRDIANKVEIKHSQSFIFGAWMGICLTVIIILIVILTLGNKSIETDPVFNRDFPTWRGIAFFIIYIWILGINTYVFEEFNVSHRIIFHYNEHHYSRSTEIFVLAGSFSTFFLIMFTIYTLLIAGIFQTGQLQPQYLVLFVWFALILFLINPIPIFMHKSRLYALKLIWIAIISPFIGVPFEVVWVTDQLVSLVTPFKDFAYTICYYTQLDFSEEINVSSNYCNAATRIEVVFVVGAIAYSYRILQCIRQGYDKGSYLLTPEFFNTLKYLSSLITLVLSYIYKAASPQIFTVWLIFAAISTVYSYFWDLKMDWKLLNLNSPHRFLRKHLTYHPYQIYYVFIFTNLIFRLAWLATLSPGIVTDTFGSPQIFSLVTGTIQIIRRGIWNLLRVEREHLDNCQAFKAMPEIPGNIESELMKELNNKNQNHEQSTAQLVNSISNIERITEQCQIVSTNFLELVQEEIEIEELSQKKRQAKCKTLKKTVKQIEEKIENMVGLDILDKKLNEDDD